MSLYTGTKPKIFSKPIKSTVRHGSEPFCPPLIILPLYLSLKKPKSFKWQDIKTSISNSPSLLARTIDWLRQSPSTSDFESDSEKPPRALLQGSSPQLPSSLPVVYDPKITFTIQPTATEINKVEIQEPLPSPNSSNFNFDSTLLSSLNEHQHVDTTDICEARAVINPPCQLPTAFPITCRTFTASPICTQESLTIQANFTGSRTKLSDCAIKINQQLSPTIKPETVKTIAQPIALARRNSLPSKSTVRPHTPLTAVVSNNYQNLCRSLDGLHGAYIKKSDSDPQIFERSQSLHSLHQDADSNEDAEQQEETASNPSRHSPSPILGPRRKNLHSSLNDIHQRFSSTPIPTTAPSQPCSRSRPNPPTSFKSPLTPGKPSGSSGSNTEHGTIHGTAAKSPHQTRRPAHLNDNVIIRQHSTSQSSCESLSPILTAQQAYTQPPSGGDKSKPTTDKRDSQQIPHNATYTTTRRLNATSIKTKQPAPPVTQSTPTENNKQFHRKQTIKMDPLQYSLVTNVIPIGDLQELQKGQRAQTMLIQLQNFTGGPSTRFDRWIKLFENIVAMSNWNEKEKMNMLVTKMAGSAHDILQNILESVTQDYKEVKRLLQERFHGNENQDFFQTQLEEVKRHPGEAILDYGLDKTLRNKVRYKPFTTYEALVAETNKYALRLDGEKEEKDKREFINAVENNSTSIEILKAIEKLPETINALATDLTTCHACGMKGHIGHRANECIQRQMQQKPNIPGPSHGQGNA
ncbi:hypothetical protein OUZ56_005027 [Daphnia magna]|uniref:CCHC-type domain-containing protein n=1 Tax=Daphnia magna TaxID=35525 RepID=A0ABQ9YRM0_9CRUS|nr:hypothetical protein OUZ56_005027 [Daphnia magna]